MRFGQETCTASIDPRGSVLHLSAKTLSEKQKQTTSWQTPLTETTDCRYAVSDRLSSPLQPFLGSAFGSKQGVWLKVQRGLETQRLTRPKKEKQKLKRLLRSQGSRRAPIIYLDIFRGQQPLFLRLLGHKPSSFRCAPCAQDLLELTGATFLDWMSHE